MPGALQAQPAGSVGLHHQAVIVLVAPHPELFHHPPGQAADPAGSRHTLQPLRLFLLQFPVAAGFLFLREGQPPHLRKVLHPDPPDILLQRAVLLLHLFQKVDGQLIQHLPAPQPGGLPGKHLVALLHRRAADQLPALFQREFRRAQLPAEVEPAGVGDGIVAVAGLLVYLGADETHFFVVPQGMGGHTQQRSHFTDGIAHGEVLLSGRQNLRATRMLFL